MVRSGGRRRQQLRRHLGLRQWLSRAVLAGSCQGGGNAMDDWHELLQGITARQRKPEFPDEWHAHSHYRDWVG